MPKNKTKACFIVEATSERNPSIVVRLEFSKLESAQKYAEKYNGEVSIRKAA